VLTRLVVLLSRLCALARSARLDDELDAEMAAHIEMLAEEHIRRGMPRDEARRAAVVRFGGLMQLKEQHRDDRGVPLVETTLQDVRYALRSLRRHPGFAAVAILSLALGVGVNTAIFSVVNGILVRPLPVEDPAQLVKLSLQQGSNTATARFSYLDYRDVRDLASSTFSGMLAYRTSLDGLDADGRADRIAIHYVSGSYFSLLGVKPALGRLILASEGEVEGADPTLVLGFSYWKARFAGDPNVVGKLVRLDGHPVTIVGVVSEQFRGAQPMLDVQAFVPLGMYGVIEGVFPDGYIKYRNLRLFDVLARLKPAVSIEQGQSVLNLVSERLARMYPRELEAVAFRADPETLTRLPGGSQGLVVVSALFLAMAALVLTLACVNLANLQMARAATRRKEIAVRAALGGSRSRLIRQLLTEGMLLLSIGALAGALVGGWTIRALNPSDIQGIPVRMDFSADWRVFAYGLAAAVAAALMAAILPAVRASRADLAVMSRDGSQGVFGGHLRVRSALVIVQVTGSFVLLILAGLLHRSLDNAQRIDLGFDSRHVVNFSIDPHYLGYNEAQGRRFFKELLRRVQALPGVESSSVAAFGPLSHNPVVAQLQIEGYAPPTGEAPPAVFYNFVSSGFFETLRIPILQGRSFAESDDQRAPSVAVISQIAAARYWPGGDPIGRKFQVMAWPGRWFEIVGIAKDGKHTLVSDQEQPYFFLPHEQNYASTQTLRVRSALPSPVLIAEVRETITALAPELPVTGVETMVAQLENGAFAPFRLGAVCAAALGLIGLALALVGLYAVVSYTAVRRTREIGIRMALGAQTTSIRVLIVRQGVILAGIGLAAGVVLSLATAPIVRRFLLGVSATDPLTFVGVAVLLSLVTLAACYLPVRRAMRIDPATALREE
jgi:macrolide transport system ATP-binding/permease protein